MSRAMLLGLVTAVCICISFLSASGDLLIRTPPEVALQAFEALRAAEAAGANISPLISEYNSILQSTNRSFTPLVMEIKEVQQRAVTDASTYKMASIVAVPLIALLLTISLEVALDVKAKLTRRRLLDRRPVRT